MNIVNFSDNPVIKQAQVQERGKYQLERKQKEIDKLANESKEFKDDEYQMLVSYDITISDHDGYCSEGNDIEEVKSNDKFITSVPWYISKHDIDKKNLIIRNTDRLINDYNLLDKYDCICDCGGRFKNRHNITFEIIKKIEN